MNQIPAFSSAQEALGMLESAMGFLAAVDASEMPAGTQAECLRTLERVDAVEIVARASILGAFTASGGYCRDADYSPKAWLVHKTRITRGAAAEHAGWARRAAAHPVVAAALAEGDMSVSWARTICGLADRLPPELRDEADAILVAAARAGLDLRDLLALGAQMYERWRSGLPGPDDDPGRAFEDRSVRLLTTFAGAGVLAGDLTPECEAVVQTVLDALSAPAGPQDIRTHEQRYHDALEEAMRRLVAAGLVPDRAGQPAKVWAHISLADLLDLDADSALLREWTAGVRARWAAARAAASAGGGDGAAWLDGDAAKGFACDAGITPVVTGEVDPAALDDLVRLCADLGGHGPGRCEPHPAWDPAEDTAGTCRPSDETGTRHRNEATPGDQTARPDGTARGSGPVPPAERGRDALEHAIIGKAAELLSGPGGLASFLRRRQLSARLGGPSLPLDVGRSHDIPAAIRTAVRLRDRHCRWPGGCSQPAAACHVHHVTPQTHGGTTSVTTCVLLCPFHHLIAIHRQGWTLTLNPDGTTTAQNPDRTKTLKSHSPPARAG